MISFEEETDSTLREAETSTETYTTTQDYICTTKDELSRIQRSGTASSSTDVDLSKFMECSHMFGFKVADLSCEQIETLYSLMKNSSLLIAKEYFNNCFMYNKGESNAQMHDQLDFA